LKADILWRENISKKGDIMNPARFFKHFSSLMVCLLISIPIGAAHAAKGVPVGNTIPAFELKTPMSPEQRQYLGLKDSETFTLSQIPSKFLLVEFYSIYCHVCQRQAPTANKIYKFILNDETMRKDIKVIGIGIKNNQKEVETYRKTYGVEFPLFSDPDKEVTKKTGIKDTPLTVLINENGKVLLSHLGLVKDVDNFLREIRNIQKNH
jgi:thiol-disulfide isomerase/thioredoxin